jgi:hypothetical protein
MHDVLKQLGYLLHGCGDKGLVLDPLGELINGDIYIFEASRSWLERPDQCLAPNMRRAKMQGWSEGLVMAHVSAWQKISNPHNIE